MNDIDIVGWSARAIQILRYYLEGHSHKEIAKLVGMAEGSVGNLISKYGMAKFREQRLRAKLQRAASDYLEEEERRSRGGTSIFGDRPNGFTVNFTPHAGQQEALDAIEKNQTGGHPAGIITLVCGRGWGKTSFMGFQLVKFLEANPNAQILWVAPFHGTAHTVVDDYFRGMNDQTGQRFVPDYDPEGRKVWEYAATRTGSVLRWHNGAVVHFRSAENSEAIVSKGYHLVVMDEFCLVQDELVFRQKILGVARRPGCRIFLCGTPRGRNWGYEIFQKGLDSAEKNYLSISQPYNRNPNFNPRLAELIKDLPEHLYRQEYLAEFIEDGAGVFKNLEQCVVGPKIEFPGSQQEWAPIIENAEGRRFVVGLDLAKSIDFTVLLGMDLDSGEVVYYRRLNQRDYKEVLSLASQVCRDLNNATLVYDSTGVGAGLSDFISSYGVEAIPYTFTNESKNELINKLSLAIEHQKIRIPNITTILKELRTFTYETTHRGRISYGAPPGLHDDTVIALALANFYREGDGVGISADVIETFIQLNRGLPRSFYEFMLQDDD